ncbi:MAG: glycosyltransferase family 4 protein [Gemmatimonadetes bacterium]|nr:glycosyltransferase family 4 protein [Gemmatimonadota bacterium]
MTPGGGGAGEERPALRVALVHDWVAGWGGSESVLRALADLFPRAPIYLGMWRPDRAGREAFGRRDVRTTWLQRLLPVVGGDHRKLLPLMPSAFRSLDLSEYDLVISSSHAFSKAVRVRPGARHVCYCHTPPRYLWDLYKTYNPGWGGALGAPLARALRRRDVRATAGVDQFIANSKTVAERIRGHYGRDSVVVYPPVRVGLFEAAAARARSVGGGIPEAWFLAGGRLVRYKRTEVLIDAANLGGFRLKVFGDGPERGTLERRAGPNVEFLGRVDDVELAGLMARCAAFLFAAEEDFGILPVEVQAAGRPVVAWGTGGATETVIHGETGLLLDEGTPEAFAAGAIEAAAHHWDPERLRANARRFNEGRFQEEALAVIRRGDAASRGGSAASSVPGRALRSHP